MVSFSGLFIGIMLVKIAPEEQKPLQRYFIFLMRAMLLAVLFFLILQHFNDVKRFLLLIPLFAFLLFAELKITDLLKKFAINYAVFGVLFFLSSKNTNLFAIESSLMLLYGLPASSLMYKKREKTHYKMLFYNMLFIATANLLYMLDYHFSFLIFM
ncbi:hypothetical protein HYY70_01300 [Candidatus Woesearchaeota archaeon]|nr:hypothetical protein [Candidatus Woesearchaeota archaeon]